MPASKDANIRRLRIELHGLQKAREELKSASDVIEGHLAWANFARHFKLVSELLLRIGKSSDVTRGQAHKMFNEMNKNEALVFLKLSRNDIDHPEDEGKDDLVAGKYKSDRDWAVVDGFGKFGLEEGSSVTFSGCVVNGKPLDGFASKIPELGGVVTQGDIKHFFERGGFFPKEVRTVSGDLIAVPTLPDASRMLSAEELTKIGSDWVMEKLRMFNLEDLVK